MSELKTLKDLKFAFEKEKEIIKEEAIKWIKHGTKKNMNFFKIFCEFHNITDKDWLL